MDIKNKLATKLGFVTKEQLSEMEESYKVMEKLLGDKDNIKTLTELSEIALDDTKKEYTGKKGKIRKSPKQCMNLYLTNQFIFRGVNVKADEIVSRGYTITAGDETGIKLCSDLIKDSGDTTFLKTFAINTEVCGDGYSEKVRNIKGNKILKLRLIHPVNFGFKTDDVGDIIIDNKTKEPVAYEQKVNTADSYMGKEIPKDRVSHLVFNKFGDEFNGISSLQSLYNTAVRLMNMENSAAEAADKTANPLWVVSTESKNLNDMKLWSKVLGNINGVSQLTLPKGIELDMKSPGAQNFNEYADYFLDAIVAALGVPRGILLGESRSGSRSQGVVLSRHFYSKIRSQQRDMENTINDIFREYGELYGFKPPVFKFNDVAEDAEVNSRSAIELYTAGLITKDEARSMIGYTGKSIKQAAKDDEMKNWHPADGNSPEGSQKGNFVKQKMDPNVPSVK